MLAYNLMDRTATNGLNHLWLRVLMSNTPWRLSFSFLYSQNKQQK